MPSTPWDARWHLRVELGRLLEALGRHLLRQRRRGRASADDAVHGFVIQDGEAEGLLEDLAADLSPPPAEQRDARPVPSTSREQIAERAELGVAQGSLLPLRHAARAFDLDAADYDAMLLALSVEVDPRFGRLIAYLNDHVGRTRPTLGLAMALAQLDGAPPLSIPDLRERPLFRDGLLELEGEGPLPGLALRVPPWPLARLVGGAEGTEWPGESGGFARHFAPEPRGLERLVLEEEVRDRLARWAETVRRRAPAPPLVLHGATGSGRTTAARGAASAAGLGLVVVDLAGDALEERLRTARCEARWYGAAVLLRIPPEPVLPAASWRLLWSGLEGLVGPVFLAVSDHVVEEATTAAPAEPAVLAVTEPGPQRRRDLWRALLPRGHALEEEEIAALATRFRFNPRRIDRAIQRALAERPLSPAGERRLERSGLEGACRAVGSAAMGPLAQKLPLPYERRELVVPDRVDAELDLALAWVRHQPRVLDDWGFARRVPMGHGLTALFAGPPGTGKTMAAQVLARELGLDLYRVDLSRVMSKYIGETEKNLARLFDEAHASGAVLFFDEADALFGKRSEVKDAHDRYANVEIGYLLQRMEEYDGVTVLATNRMRDLDEAFLRRFQVVVDFPMPSEADRLRIWEGMFSTQAARDEDLDLGRLARGIEVSGGEIKNAVLAAAYLAAAEGRPIGMSQLQRALHRELVKSGRVVDERELRSPGA